jgi:NADH-quinone oxidoreductase subunit G
VSAQHSNEDNFALLKLGRDLLGAKSVYLAGKPQGTGDNVLRHPDKNPNTRGAAAAVGSTTPRLAELAKAVADGKIKTILALGSDIGELADAAGLDGAKVVVIAAHEGPLSKRASVLLPATSWAECDGTFVNAKGKKQVSEQAIGPRGESRPAWKLIGALGVRLGHETAWRKLALVRQAMEPPRSGPPLGAKPTQPGASS